MDAIGAGQRAEVAVQDVRRSTCRCCINRCAIRVEVADGRVVHVGGDRDDPMYQGYSCVKGRRQPDYLYHPDRLLHSLKRNAEGDFVPIPIEDAIGEIADKLIAIRSEFGPRAIAGYWGTRFASTEGVIPLYEALLSLLGTRMNFSPITIDKGGKQVAEAMFGRWMAPAHGFDRPDVALLIGANPLLTYTGVPVGNPNRWLKESLDRGMKLIVIDPRRTEIARRATHYLQAKPGHDPEILAAMINVIVREHLYDKEFLDENVRGFDEARRAVEPFTPEMVAARAGLAAGEITQAARVFAGAGRGYAWAGTGPSMAGTGTLAEYLVLVLDTICGHWSRAGDEIPAAPVLMAPRSYKAQAESPVPWSLGDPMRVRSLTRTVAGSPTAALADEILLAGEGQVKALLCVSGNPAIAFPDQIKTIKALNSLSLLVQVDAFMSETAKIADYVIAPVMSLEADASSLLLDSMSLLPSGYGSALPYAHYSTACVPPPAGADLVEEWEFLRGIYVQVDRALRLAGEDVCDPPEFIHATTTAELLEKLTHGSRIPFDVVRSHNGGALYPDRTLTVAMKDEGWDGRFDVANPEILTLLDTVASDGMPRASSDDGYPFRLLCRRMNHVMNTSFNIPATHRGRPYNPAFMNPGDLTRLGLASGDLVEIRSSQATILGVVEADADLRPGSVSMAFGYGGPPGRDHLVREIGSSPSRLVSDSDVYDQFIGQPRMSNVPVRVTRCPSAGDHS